MKVKTWLIVGAFLLVTGGLQVSAFALPRAGRGGEFADFHGEMHGGGDHDDFHGGFRGGDFDGRGFAGPSFGLGWGWGWNSPWDWNPYYYSRPNVIKVPRANYGTVEFNVKPKDSKVYVDQKFIGTVNDLDHHQAYVPAGNHEIKLVAPDGHSVDRTLYIAAGKKIKIKEDF